MRPTVLIGVPSHAKLSDELAKFDLSVVMLANENITDVLATIDSIGHLIHRTEDAANLIQSIKDSLLTLASDSHDPGPSAMLVIGREKGTVKNITVAGDDTFINEIWQLVGGTNLFLDLPSRYSSVNLETIITRNPEVIIEFNIDGAVEITRTEETQIWKQLKNISAVRDGNIYNVGGSHTLIPGPRIVLLAKQFKDIIDKVSLETKN